MFFYLYNYIIKISYFFGGKLLTFLLTNVYLNKRIVFNIQQRSYK